MKPGNAGMNKTAGVTWLCGLKHRFVLITSSENTFKNKN
jgi:hypothetical protein